MTTTAQDPPRASAQMPAAPEPAAVERSRNPTLRGSVLLATDATRSSETAILAAGLIADHLGVGLRVVSVLEPLAIYGVADPMTIEAERSLARDAAVRQRVREVVGTRLEWDVTIRHGSVARQTANLAREISASLIVLGAAPHRRFRHTVSGERAAQVLRLADCPVLSVDAAFGALPHSVLVGVDFSAASVRAAQAALLLLDAGGTLTLVHVVPPLEFGVPMRDLAPGLAVLFAHLRDELRPFVPPGVGIETRHAVGAVGRRLVACAKDIGADLIAVGTHGPGVFERFLVGSVAAGLLHEPVSSVLASPAPPAAEAFRIDLRLNGSAASEDEHDWAEVLDGFTHRNTGRKVTVEVDDPSLGAQVQAVGYSLLGATYDRHDARINVMLGGQGDDRRHLTRAIDGVETIALCAGRDGRDSVLVIKHGKGHTLLMLEK